MPALTLAVLDDAALPGAVGTTDGGDAFGDRCARGGVLVHRVAVTAGGTVPAVLAGTAVTLHGIPGTGALVLVAHGVAGPLLPALAATQRAARRRVVGSVFVDALLPRPAGGTLRELLAAAPSPTTSVTTTAPAPGTEDLRDQRLPPAADWPDVPCGYLVSTPPPPHANFDVDFWARSATRRGWPVRFAGADPVQRAEALLSLLAALPGVDVAEVPS